MSFRKHYIQSYYTSSVLCVLLLVKISAYSLIRLIYLLYVKKRAKKTQLKSNQYSYPIVVDGIYEFHIFSNVVLSLPLTLKASRNASSICVMSLLLNLVWRLHGALLLRYSVINYRRAKLRIQDFRNDLRFRSVPHEHNLCPQRSSTNLFWTCFSNVSSFSWWVFLFVRGGLCFRNGSSFSLCVFVFVGGLTSSFS